MQAPEKERFCNWAETHRLQFLDRRVAILEQDGFLYAVYPDANEAVRIAAALNDALAGFQNCQAPRPAT